MSTSVPRREAWIAHRAAVQAARWLLSAILIWTADAAALPVASLHRWHEAHTAHFSVMGDVSVDLLTDVACQLERGEAMFDALTTGIRADTTKPMLVYLFRESRDLNRDYYPTRGDGSDVGGYCLQGERVTHLACAGAEPAALRHTVMHEYTHAVLKDSFGMLPPWIDEGLAEYFSTAEFEPDFVRVGRPPTRAMAWARARMRPFCQLLAVTLDSAAYRGPGSSAFYAESWLVAHILMTAGGHGDARVSELLDRLSLGRTGPEAVAEVFGANACDSLADVLRTYVRRSTVTARETRFESRLFDCAPPRLRALPHAEALLRLGVLLAAHGGKGETAAGEHLLESWHADSTVAETADRLASLALRKGDESAAEQWRAAAVRCGGLPVIHAQDIVWAAEYAHWREARVPAALTDTTLLEARRVLDAALAKDPQNPDLLEAYARTFLYERSPDPAAMGAAVAATGARPERSSLDGTRALLAIHSGELALAAHLCGNIPETPRARYWKRRAALALMATADDSIRAALKRRDWERAESLAQIVAKAIPQRDQDWTKTTLGWIRSVRARAQ